MSKKRNTPKDGWKKSAPKFPESINRHSEDHSKKQAVSKTQANQPADDRRERIGPIEYSFHGSGWIQNLVAGSAVSLVILAISILMNSKQGAVIAGAVGCTAIIWIVAVEFYQKYGEEEARKTIVETPRVVTGTPPPVVPTPTPTTPTIAPSPRKSRFTEKKDQFAVKVGDNGATIGFTTSTVPKALMRMGEVNVLSAQIMDGRVVVNAQLFDAKIKLDADELSGRPLTWDSNHDETALEIVNENGMPVFQLEYKSDQLAVVRGVFSVGDALAVVTDGIGFYRNTSNVPPITMPAIFKYPSGMHMGERN